MTDPQPTALFAQLSFTAGVLTARLVGPSIGQREGEVIAATIESALAQHEGVRHVVMDCEDITYINSSGLGACVTVHNQAKARKAGVILYRLRADLRDVFKMTRMDRIFTIANDEKRLAKALK